MGGPTPTGPAQGTREGQTGEDTPSAGLAPPSDSPRIHVPLWERVLGGKLQAGLQPGTPSTHTLLPADAHPPTSTHTSPAIRPPDPVVPKNTGRREQEPRRRCRALGVTQQAEAHLPTVPAACPQPCLRTNPGPRSGAVRKVHSPSHQSGPGVLARKDAPSATSHPDWSLDGARGSTQSSQVDPGPCTLRGGHGPW